MENKKKKSTSLLLSILGVISLVLITAGVTYAFFSYAKQGEKENTITTGSITFIYNETGDALNIQDALPKSDAVGMADTDAFTFTVTSTTPNTAYINYIVTAKKVNTSTLPEDQVKLYLAEPTGSSDGSNGAFASTIGVKTGTVAGSILTFDNLPDADDSAFATIFPTGRTAPSDEKVIYAGQVPTNQKESLSATYAKTFNLRMWLLGAEERCFDGTTIVASATTAAECTAAGEAASKTYTWRADTTGMKDYSAYEFVAKSALIQPNPATDPVTYTDAVYTVVDTGTAAVDTNLVKGTEILTSVDYYAALEAGTIQASDYTRLAAVNQTERKVYTVAQPVASKPAASGNWEDSEQFYPFNGGTFKVKLNVYAEGATTYTVQAQP